MKRISQLFKKPYPLEERKPAQLKLALLFGVVVFLFIFILNPFGQMPGSKALFTNASVAGALTFFTITLNFFLLFPIFPLFFKEEKWTVGRELVWTFIIIISIATVNMLAGVLFGGGRFSMSSWIQMIFYTSIIGIAPAAVSIILNQQRLLKKYKNEAAVINETIVPAVEENLSTVEKLLTTVNEPKPLGAITDLLTIVAENEKDNLTITAASFLAATSADNYVKIFFLQDNKLATAVMRTTLKKLEENTISYPQIFRSHRTALVNLTAVKKLTGTAQGYRLILDLLPDEIPVSRSLNSVIKEKLASIHP